MLSVQWKSAGEFTDITYEKAEGIAKITINRPEVRNAFRPLTVDEMSKALSDARYDDAIRVIILTGEARRHSAPEGDQRIRARGVLDESGRHRLNVLDFQRQMRPAQAIIAMVAGYASRGGTSSPDGRLTIAAKTRHLRQTGPKVPFDGGYGASYLARIVGQKKAREIWFLLPSVHGSRGAGYGARQRSRAL